jgi:hypothetical protein
MRTFPRSTIGLATPWEYRRPNPRKVHLLRACGNGSLVRAQIRRRFSNRPNTPVSTPPLTPNYARPSNESPDPEVPAAAGRLRARTRAGVHDDSWDCACLESLWRRCVLQTLSRYVERFFREAIWMAKDDGFECVLLEAHLR